MDLGHAQSQLPLQHAQRVPAQPCDHHGTQVSHIGPTLEGVNTTSDAVLGGTQQSARRGSLITGTYPGLQDADVQAKVGELAGSHEPTDSAPHNHHLEGHLAVHGVQPGEHPVVDEAIALQVAVDTQHQVGLAYSQQVQMLHTQKPQSLVPYQNHLTLTHEG